MQIIFGRRVRTAPRGRVPHPAAALRRRVTINSYFRHSRVKSYLKCGRVLRIETVINDADPRVMALAGAFCAIVHTITGFTNRSLRAQVSMLLGAPYSMSQMSYDLHTSKT